jgi:pimeloyl-ACP methyl ester carboxylesterase
MRSRSLVVTLTVGLFAALTSCTPAPPSSSVPKDPVIIVGGTFVVDPVADVYYAPLRTRLANAGYRAYIWAIPDAGFDDIGTSAASLASFVDQVLANTGAERVDLIGHSQGGLVARHYVKYLGGDAKVDSLISLGAPHYGTLSANIVTFLGLGTCLGVPSCEEMSQGSAYLADLNDGPDQIGPVRYTNIATTLDEFVYPYRNSFLANDVPADNRNVLLQDQCPLRIVGHLLLATDGAVYSGIVDALAHRAITFDCLAL